MQRPLIFLSAVSSELASARRLAAAMLHQLGYDTVSQDNFPTGHGELLQWLREQVSRCDGLLQLVGEAYGDEPPEPSPEFGRVSYTQFELLLARRLGKKTWVVEARPGYPCDRAPDQLDRPRDPSHPDPAGYQAERRDLQLAYRQQLRAENHLRHAADSEVKLQLILKNLNDELAELRRRTERSWRRLNAAVAGILAVLLLLAGGGWWAYQRLHREVVATGKVDATRIRAHLLESTDRARARELAEAEAIPGWEERQRQRDAAEAAYQARLGRLDELTAFLAELEGRADVTDISRELSRILAAEGVDEALAYLDHQRPGIFERARSRLAATREQNRAELEPLLTAARLENQRGQVDRARELFTQVQGLEPEWPRALTAFAWFLRDQAIQQRVHGSLAAAVADATQMLALAEKLPPTERLSYEDARVLPAALHEMAEVLVLRGQPGDAEQALGHLQRDLEILERLLTANPDSAEAARDVSVSLLTRGDLLSRRGQPGDAEQALVYGQRSLEIGDRLLTANPESAQAARDVSVSLVRLADLLFRRGQPGDAEKAWDHLQRDLEILERLLTANPDSAEAARDVSLSLNKLADFLSRRGQPGDAEQALGQLQRSLEISERLLTANPDSALAARDVSMSLDALAVLTARRGQPGDAKQALDQLQRSLEIRERLRTANPESAQAARDVSVSLHNLADFLSRRGQPGDAEQALGQLQRSLEILESLLTASPQSALAARDVSVILEKLAVLLARRDQPGDTEQALGHLQRGLAISERLLTENPESAQAARDVSASLENLADLLARRGQPGDTEQALGHWQRSLEVSERLLTANPESAEAARDVSVILEKLAVLLARRGQPGDAEQALVYGQRGLEISEWQLIASPESAEAARDVSMSLETLAVLIARRAKPGDSEQALDHLQRGLEIRERLLTANPESAQAARDVFRSHFRLSELHRQRGDEQAAKDSFAKCFAILDDFVKRGRPMDAEMRDLHSQLQPLFSKP